MQKLIATATAITLLAILAAAQERNIGKDEAGIKKVIDALNESFQKRDAKLRASLFTEDGVFINAFGVQEMARRRLSSSGKNCLRPARLIKRK
jgi:hypothetical protein